MSTRIGGPHQCNIHPDFVTEDTNEFNEHCKTAEGHTTSGVYHCGCGCEINLDGVNFQPIGETPNLKCPECYQKQEDLQQQVLKAFQNTDQIEIQEEGGQQNV